MEKKIINEDHKITVLIDKQLPTNMGIGEIIFKTLRENKGIPMQVKEKKIISEDHKLRVSIDMQMPFEMGIGEIIFNTLRENKGLPMQIDGLTGEVDTYDSFLQRTIRVAIKMHAKGTKPGDIISVCSHNHLNTMVPIMASFLLGSIPASIDPSLSPSDCKHLLGMVKPKMIFANLDSAKLVENVVKELGIDSEIIVFGDSANYTEFSQFLEEYPEEEKAFSPIKILNLKETAAMFFSSGTTGLAKAVCLKHISLIAQIPSQTQIKALSNTVQLNYSSPYWESSIHLFLLTIMTKGSRLVYRNFDVKTFWNAIQKYKVYFAKLSTTQIAAICRTDKPSDADTSSLKVLFTIGSMVYKEQLSKLHRLFPTTLFGSGYGQTELGPSCLYFDLDQTELKYIHSKPTSCGRPRPGFIYKVIDLETEKALGPFEKGELRVKTDYCMNGYYGVDSTSSWDSEGFIKTGDIFYYDDEYCFYFVDRLKDLIKFQGWQIAPAKLESILLSHPEVEVAVVLGLPHSVDGNHPVGVVQLRKPDSNITSEDLQKYFEGKIDDDKHRLRGGLKIVDNIPMTPTEKYRKKHLKDMIVAGML